MKIKKKKNIQGGPSADDLGEAWYRLREQSGAIEATRRSIQSEVMKVVERAGVTEGKRRVVRGKKFVVGVLTPDDTMEIDYQKLLSLVPSSVAKAIQVRVVSPEEVEREVNQGTISRKLLRKCLVVKREASPRMYIKLLNEET